jgi:DNA-binding transcriptional MocR family regulator
VLQRLVAALWTDAGVQGRVEHAATVYAGRREALLRALRAHGFDAHGTSGLNVWLEVEEEAGTLAALLAAGWAVAPGSRYKLHERSGAIRITSAALEPADAERFAAVIAGVLAPAAPVRSG